MPHKKQYRNSNRQPKGQRYKVESPTTLLEFLLGKLKQQSRNSIKGVLRRGQVWLNGSPTTHFNTPLAPDDEVLISHEKVHAPFNHPQLRMVYEDDDIIVVDKKDGLLSVSDSPTQERTAYFILTQYVKKSDARNKIFILHRLDKGTSGLMMFAKNLQTQEKLRNNWYNMITRRSYVAVVEGVPLEPIGTIKTYLAENKWMKVFCTDEALGKEAVSHYQVLTNNKAYSMVELELETGRKNQIRAQMEFLGHPVAGDPKYGAQTDPARRLMLHAQRLFFIHPTTGNEMQFETPVPPLFEKVLKNPPQKSVNTSRTSDLRSKGFILPLLLCLIFAACTQKQFYEESGTVFHTLYHIKYESDKLLTDEIDAELQKFNLSLNPFNENSILAKVNRNEAVEVDDWFMAVFNKAVEVSEKSGGAFDCTAAPLINLWGFGFKNSGDITQQAIDSIKAFVGYRKVRLDGRRVVKDDPRIELNFSAIAKGYASDVIASLLERHGVKNYMVEFGGEVTAKGKNPLGNCWRIGINKPEYDTTSLKNDIEQVVNLCKPCGLATSGNYRNFYVKDGKRYAHTIDPRTGYPSEQSILSATIIAPDCMTADAYATALMALGLEAALKMVEDIPEIDYYLIYDNGEDSSYQILFSEGMEALM